MNGRQRVSLRAIVPAPLMRAQRALRRLTTRLIAGPDLQRLRDETQRLRDVTSAGEGELLALARQTAAIGEELTTLRVEVQGVREQMRQLRSGVVGELMERDDAVLLTQERRLAAVVTRLLAIEEHVGTSAGDHPPQATDANAIVEAHREP